MTHGGLRVVCYDEEADMGSLRNIFQRTCSLAAAILVVTAGASGGATWNEIDSGLPSVGVGVTSLVVDPTSSSTVYALTQVGNSVPFVPGLFETTNGGGIWRAVSNVTGVAALAIDPKKSTTLYVGTDRGVVKSTD